VRLRTTPKLAKRANEGEGNDLTLCPVNYDFRKTKALTMKADIFKGKLVCFFTPAYQRSYPQGKIKEADNHE
jgi:hypothetical protein